MEPASLYSVCEPELDMNRQPQHHPAERWRRLRDAIARITPGDAMLGRPKRSVDRERQEFPSSLD
ncbi:MAG: hypothetical protein WA005_09550 [Candidatus Binataceae bacterium]